MCPSQNGVLGCDSQVTFAKVPWGIHLFDKKGRASKSGEESCSKRKQRDEQCSGQSKEPKKRLLFRRLERISVADTQDASVEVKEGWPYQGPMSRF